jgi:glycosyltransferase involved in cell wall biosynthesis
MGEAQYFQRLLPLIQKYQEKGRWEFLGVLDQEELAKFYSCLDLLVVPSLNSTETFGLVQIEAMIRGTPSIASNLPGVRMPPRLTGMGEVVPIGDSEALADAIIKITNDPETYYRPGKEVEDMFDPMVNAAAYESLYTSLLERAS